MLQASSSFGSEINIDWSFLIARQYFQQPMQVDFQAMKPHSTRKAFYKSEMMDFVVKIICLNFHMALKMHRVLPVLEVNYELFDPCFAKALCAGKKNCTECTLLIESP